MKEWKQEFKDYYTIGDYVFKAEVIPDDVINFIEQIISERDREIIKILENTDVQMSANGDVSEDEKAMAKFLYKAHCNHIIKKLQTYGK